MFFKDFKYTKYYLIIIFILITIITIHLYFYNCVGTYNRHYESNTGNNETYCHGGILLIILFVIQLTSRREYWLFSWKIKPMAYYH